MGRPPKTNLPPELSELLKVIGRNVSSLRSKKRLSQTELSRRSKVSLTTINEIETRQFRDIRLSTLSAIARSLGVPIVRVLERSKSEPSLTPPTSSVGAAYTITGPAADTDLDD